MAEPSMHTDYDLRDPEQRADLDRKVRAYVKRRSTEFTCRAMSEQLGCSMVQGRNVLNRLIGEGAVTCSGATKDVVYSPAA